jgi:hypothetical protein
MLTGMYHGLPCYTAGVATLRSLLSVLKSCAAKDEPAMVRSPAVLEAIRLAMR